MTDPKPLIEVNNQQVAEQICDLLRANQIQPSLQQRDDKWIVSLQYAAQLPKARQLVHTWLQQLQQRQADYLWQHGKPLQQSSGFSIEWGGMLNRALKAPFMSLILILCAVFFLASASLWFAQVKAFLHFAPLTEIAETGQWWRLIGPTLLHYSALHIVFNLLWWWQFGTQIETRFGTITLLLLYLVSGVASNYAQFLASGVNFGGLSGVVYALFGFIWWIGWLRPSWGIGLPKAFIGLMLVWLLIGYANVLPVQMANTAHLVGMLMGCAIATLIAMLGRR